MVIGWLKVRLNLREARSLKDKRQVVQSITQRLKQNFNASVAEVEDHDVWKSIVLGIGVVGDEVRPVKTVLDAVADALRKHPVAQFASCESSVERCLGGGDSWGGSPDPGEES